MATNGRFARTQLRRLCKSFAALSTEISSKTPYLRQDSVNLALKLAEMRSSACRLGCIERLIATISLSKSFVCLMCERLSNGNRVNFSRSSLGLPQSRFAFISKISFTHSSHQYGQYPHSVTEKC